MIEMTEDEKIERLKLFLKERTYTYIFNIFEYHFNGYVKDLDKNKILFLDDVLGKIPIRIAEIKSVNYSTKEKESSSGNKGVKKR